MDLILAKFLPLSTTLFTVVRGAAGELEGALVRLAVAVGATKDGLVRPSLHARALPLSVRAALTPEPIPGTFFCVREGKKKQEERKGKKETE